MGGGDDAAKYTLCHDEPQGNDNHNVRSVLTLFGVGRSSMVA